MSSSGFSGDRSDFSDDNGNDNNNNVPRFHVDESFNDDDFNDNNEDFDESFNDNDENSCNEYKYDDDVRGTSFVEEFNEDELFTETAFNGFINVNYTGPPFLNIGDTSDEDDNNEDDNDEDDNDSYTDGIEFTIYKSTNFNSYYYSSSSFSCYFSFFP
jgi:hypothetical protein